MLSLYHEEPQKKYSNLTISEEIELAKKIKKGDKRAEEKLICSNLTFVISICRKYVGQGVNLEDLIGSGNIGLIEAAKRYDPETHNNEKFITFAVWYIKHYVFENIIMNKFIYRIPNTYHNDILKYNKARVKLEQKLNRIPTKEEFLKDLEMDEQRYDTITDLMDQNKFVSLTDYVSKAKGIIYSDVICNEAVSIDKTYELRERRKEIFKALDILEERERSIIISYYGLMGVSLSLKELGESFSLTREAIRIIKNKALKKLKSKGLSLKDYV